MAGTSRDAPVIYYIPKSVTRTTIFLKIYIVICTTFRVKLYITLLFKFVCFFHIFWSNNSFF